MDVTLPSISPTTTLTPTLIPKNKPLSELILSAPNAFSFKSLTSHARDIHFHSYLNEPPLFNIEVPNSYPSPITLILRSPEKSVIAKCVPAHEASSKPGKWEIFVTYPEETELPRDGQQPYPEKQASCMMEKLGKDTYQLSALWLQPLISTSTPATPQRESVFHWQRQEYQTATVTKFTKPDWKLINLSTAEVLAVFVERWGAKERGSMQFRRSFGREWELGVVLSVGLLSEEGRRRKRKRGNFAMGFAQGGGGVSM